MSERQENEEQTRETAEKQAERLEEERGHSK